MTNEREPPPRKHPLLALVERAIEQLPDGAKKHWKELAAAAAASGAATVAGFLFVLWKSRQKAKEEGLQDDVDKIVKNLPEPSRELRELSVVELSQAAAQTLRELKLRTLKIALAVCEELDARLSLEDDVADTLTSAAASAAQKEIQDLQ